MSVLIENRAFELRSDLELPSHLSDATLRGCSFSSCHFGATAKTPARRRSIQRVKLEKCKTSGACTLGPVSVEDVEIEDLRTGGLCISRGAVFRHVTFRGRCGKFMFSPLDFTDATGQVQQFARANQKFYDDTDWALDISEATFDELCIRNVPARLIRRNPETQVVVRRERAAATEKLWQDVHFGTNLWRISLGCLMMLGLEDTVLVARANKKYFDEDVAGLRQLQREGVADPD